MSADVDAFGGPRVRMHTDGGSLKTHRRLEFSYDHR
jgi:hypothetical protein